MVSNRPQSVACGATRSHELSRVFDEISCILGEYVLLIASVSLHTTPSQLQGVDCGKMSKAGSVRKAPKSDRTRCGEK
jgi:hypothetical protein